MATDTKDGAQWLNTADAATALGISQRTIRRQCEAGDLLSKRVGGAWRVAASAVKSDTVRPSVAAITDKAATEADTEADTVSNAIADISDAVRPSRTGEADNTAKTDTSAVTSANAEIISDLRDQVAFLRASVEQHQRSEAELRAALREALRAMPKQLAAGAPDEAPGGQGEAPTATPDKAATDAPEARPRPATREPRPLWKAVLGIR